MKDSKPDTRLWCWSWTGDHGPFHGPSPSQGDAIIEALNSPPKVGLGAEHPWLYLARCSPPLASAFLPDLDTLLNGARTTAQEMLDTAADGWLDHVSAAEHQDLLDRVGRAFDDWASQHHRQPEFFQVEDPHHLTFGEANALAINHARELLRTFAGLPPLMLGAALEGLIQEATKAG